MNTSLKGMALITGTSSGIDAVYAERLARQSFIPKLPVSSTAPRYGVPALNVGGGR